MSCKAYKQENMQFGLWRVLYLEATLASAGVCYFVFRRTLLNGQCKKIRCLYKNVGVISS